MMTTPRPTTATAGAGTSRQRDLQAMLQDRQREMLTVLRRRVHHAAAEGPSGGGDEPDRAEAEIQDHIEVAVIQMKGDTLKRVQEALVRLAAGEYGYCAECEGEISEQRLRALPFAVRCTVCEALHEQHAARERRFSTPQGFPFLFAAKPGF